MAHPHTIRSIEVHDIRFPTSRERLGSDAMHPDPDYSMAYVVVRTDGAPPLEGHGFTFTIGRGNDLCVAGIWALEHLVVGRSAEDLFEDMGAFWCQVTGDDQLRWLGPDKGVLHLATCAVVNAIWDMLARARGLPLWRLLLEMSPQQVVDCVDFRYLSDALTPAEAVALLEAARAGRAAREQELARDGYPGYTMAAAWLGFSDEQVRALVREALAEGWDAFKMKVGADPEADRRRAALMREEIGPDRALMMDANQRWGVGEAIDYMARLAEYGPRFIEEPTSPDDILGHAAIAKEIAPILVATGEHVPNMVIFKQFFQAGGLHVCQYDPCRVGGVNEMLGILLMAARFDIPVCPHGGGAGLDELAQHLCIFDYIAVSGNLRGRVLEYVGHLHEHFSDPVTVSHGRFRLPERPGFSSALRPEAIGMYRFPEGTAWQRQ
jgi:L-fuconate dehydratase